MLPIIFILPLLQLVILSNAASFEVKNIKFSYIDHDHSAASRELISKFEASNYFDIMSRISIIKKKPILEMQKGNVDVILEIPIYFERNLIKQKNTNLSVSINAIDGAAAGVSNVYITQIISGYNQSIQTQLQTLQSRKYCATRKYNNNSIILVQQNIELQNLYGSWNFGFIGNNAFLILVFNEYCSRKRSRNFRTN